MSPSIWQILIVLVIILLLFGPKRIPGVGKSLGEAIRGFKKGLNEDAIDVTDSSSASQEKLDKDKVPNSEAETETKKETDKA